MIEIKEIPLTRNELKKFVQLQIDMYEDNPYFVPPLVSDDVDTLDPKKNPAYDFCDVRCWMAYRNGRPVGRIAGIINNTLNEKHGAKDIRFGFIDFPDEIEVSRGLLEKVEEWGKERGLKRIVGPLGFTDLDYEGMLVEGYDQLSTMATIYNYSYYPEHMHALGYEKDTDWVEYLMEVPDAIPEKHNRISEIVKKKFGLKVAKFKSKKEIKEKYGYALFQLINEAYEKLYQYSPLTDRQIEHYIDVYLGLLDLSLVSCIVDADDKLVGVGISMPSMSKALQKSKGKMLPFGWIHLLKGLKGKNDRVDLLLVAIKPEYQGKGVNALLFQDLIPAYIDHGYRYVESNPELESNAKVQNQWDSFVNRQHKRRRSYFKEIEY
ncbi:MAG: N-acetyltransferase [Muribaculaceae bacterium]|nr:N-acetyltransferase [Bacteroides sp.]MDE6056884.1 N-acetyltransferase [Muribaculaceae bacterium]MDE6193389.1 N-acetyltransferase [Muribaculaceae bacterium]MDE6855393.1 N-acetyltransferase [Muribaculaceae bacterium]